MDQIVSTAANGVATIRLNDPESLNALSAFGSGIVRVRC